MNKKIAKLLYDRLGLVLLESDVDEIVKIIDNERRVDIKCDNFIFDSIKCTTPCSYCINKSNNN